MSGTQPRHAAAATATVSPTHISNFDTGLAGVNQTQNMLFRDMLWWSMGIIALVILSLRAMELAWTHLRHVSAMSLPASGQNYWRSAQWGRMAWIKKNLLYAPIWKKRHNREIRVSSALNIGTLPTRFQAVLLLGYLGSNLAYMFILDYSQPIYWSMLAEMRGRSGSLAAVNMVPLIIFAGRNNPLIGMLRISFDTFNLLHRWVGRTVVAEVVIHTVAWLIVQVNDGGWASVNFKILHDRFISSGMVGTVAFVVLLLISFSPLRHAFYETFLATHIILAFTCFVCTWVHCATPALAGGLPQLPYIIAIVALWLADRLGRIGLNAYYSWSLHGWPDAIVEPMPEDCCRVTIHLPRYADIKPGTHAYLRFMNINPWESHPFSIAWVEHTPVQSTGTDSILPTAEKYYQQKPGESSGSQRNNKNNTDKSRHMRTSVSFVIGAQTGFTRKLLNRARETGLKAPVFKALFEGPYAGHHSLDSYGHAVLVAGATGITHQISYLRHLIEGYGDGTVAMRRITLVWIVRDYEALEWIRPWMNEVLRMPNRHEILQIRLFVTRPKRSLNPSQINSRTIQMFPGRPNIPVLLKKEVGEQNGAMVVTVCGPGALADDVRAAVRAEQDDGTVVDFIEESFTW